MTRTEEPSYRLQEGRRGLEPKPVRIDGGTLGLELPEDVTHGGEAWLRGVTG